MRRIVFVEDQPEYAEIIKRLHKDAPSLFCGEAELITVQTLSMLRHVLAANEVSLVILDLTLPDSHQKETVEFIGRERNNLPPIFVLTGDERIEVRQQCISMGAVGFAAKKHVVESPNFFFATLYNEYWRHLQHHA